MPITQMYFKGGVFFAKEVGRIGREDARSWSETVREYTDSSPTPIAAVVDALEVTFVTSEARQIFVRCSHIPNFAVGAVATQDSAITYTAHVIGAMSERGHSFVFPTVEEAWDFAVEKLKKTQTNATCS
jgi:hypothetical protein